MAQGGSATVTGTVYDPQNAVIPGAKVQLVQQDNKTVRETTASNSGVFSFAAVAPGRYTLTVKADGFASYERKDMDIHINDQVDLKNVVLKVSSAGVVVDVSGETVPLVPLSSGEKSYTIEHEQIDNLAIEGRNTVELLKIIPGAQNSGGWNGTYTGELTSFNNGAGAYTVNGTRFDQMAVVSDGGNTIDHGCNCGSMVTANVEMVQEAKVETASYSAENPNGPIVISTQTKSGGRNFHGEGYYSVRDSSMNANDWQNKYYDVAKPADRYQYPGFNIGGPVYIPGKEFNKNRDKLFFFAGFEWMRQLKDLGVHKSVIPTEAWLNGDFSDTAYLDALANTGVSAHVCDPSYGTLAAYCSGNYQVSTSAIDAGGLALLKVYRNNMIASAVRDPAGTGHGYNYVTDIINSEPRVQQLLKMDYVANSNTRLSVRYNHEAETIPYPYGLWQTWPNTPYPGNVVGYDSSHSVAASLSSVLSSSTTNELNGTINYLNYGNRMTTPGNVSLAGTGYPYYGVYNNGVDVIPNVGGMGVADIYDEGGVYPNQVAPKWTYTLSDTVSVLKSSHLFKFGVNASRIHWTQRTGTLDQGSIELASWGTYTDNGYADLLTGHIAMYTQSTGNIVAHWAADEFDFFAQDSWKIGRRFTLNYGLRMDHIGWWYNQDGYVAIFNPSKYNSSAAISAYTGIETHNSDSSVSRSGYKPVGEQPSPQVGFSWDVTGSGKTVLRGGFGVNYFRDEGNTAASNIENPPLMTTNYFTGSWPGYVQLSSLSSITQSAALPWLNVAVPSEGKAPRTYSYSMNLQRQLPGGTMLEASYVGNISRHLVGWRDINAVPEGSETGQAWPGSWMDPSYRPYANIAGIYAATHTLKANYNSIQVMASRDKGAINYWISYVFSKALGNTAADAFDDHRTYGPLSWDRTNSFKIAYNITLPNVSAKHLGNHKTLNGVLDGWQVSGVSEFDSGGPLLLNGSFTGTFLSMTGPSDLVNRYVDGTPDENLAPVLVCDPRKGLRSHQYFNAACFEAPTAGHNGAYRLPYIHGPWYNNTDLSMFKNFQLRDKMKLQIRAEAFNLLNHPLWEFTSSDTNLILNYSDLGTTPTNANTAGYATNKTGHRTVQFAVKFYF